MSRTLTVGPFNRVEGDLEVHLDLAEGRVAAARVNAPLFRGFETMLLGRHPLDALAIVPRICGICSVAQSAAAAAALADASGLSMAANGRLAQNLILACENVCDHLTHFYVFFMPDFAAAGYAGQEWYAGVAGRFRAQQGTALGEWLPARAGFLRLLGVLAGKWPHTLALQPGGTTRSVTATEKVRLAAVLREFRAFLEETLFGDTLATVAALPDGAALAAWAAGRDSDFARFVQVALALGLDSLGRGSGSFLAGDAYGAGAAALFTGGVWQEGARSGLDPAQVREDVRHAWLSGSEALPPSAGLTRPEPDKADAYTWCKAPRYAGAVMETGALARQLLAGQPLAGALVAASGGSVLARVVARLVEVARLLPAMEGWLAALEPGAPICTEWQAPAAASGVGLVEAARGTLGHWLAIRDGVIAGYQIIAPTTWNFSPRDGDGTPGALEQALVGLPVADGDRHPLLVQHVVRSFDPCMVCTVH